MAEYQYSPLWDLEEPDNLDPAELPLKKETAERLLKWAKTYDEVLNWDEPASSDFASEEDAQAFEAEGISLWQQLQKELAPDYQVYYFSEQKRQLFNPTNELKSTA
ncbi:MAG: hypothetical protein ACRDEA_09290 [Microcystaceae cyanobacterium]